MKILSHRGYWMKSNEKNTELAFKRSFALGYGTETDIRDYRGDLVISHDIPVGTEMRLDAFLSLAKESIISQGISFTLALNIKADGLVPRLKKILDSHTELDVFAFDMSVPDMHSYLIAGVPVFTRMSEVERQPVWFDLSAGVWLDSFYSDWYDIFLIENLLSSGKRVCIVSPELHQRPYVSLWNRIKPLAGEENLMICTDYPEKASRYFFDWE